MRACGLVPCAETEEDAGHHIPTTSHRATGRCWGSSISAGGHAQRDARLRQARKAAWPLVRLSGDRVRDVNVTISRAGAEACPGVRRPTILSGRGYFRASTKDAVASAQIQLADCFGLEVRVVRDTGHGRPLLIGRPGHSRRWATAFPGRSHLHGKSNLLRVRVAPALPGDSAEAPQRDQPHARR